MNQPYQAPKADTVVAGGETYHPKMFSASGRIGRMRYFVYGAIISLLFYAVLLVAVGVVAAVNGGFSQAGQQGGAMASLGLGYFALIIAALVFGIIFMVRRLNDINASGWLSLLLLVPLANLILILVMLFKRGSEGANNYGPAPEANSPRVKAVFAVMLVLWLVFFVGGILAAISIPAYQDYVQRAQAEQMEYQGY